MQSLWSDQEAVGFQGDLGLRVYSSRLLGRDPTLVLHGGGNTSVKLVELNLHGEPEDILYVKGSGWDLETIESAGFAPLRLAPVRRLAELVSLSDPAMVNALRTQMTRADAPAPSVESILHAVIPHRYVDHTHADAVLALTDTAQGAESARELYGDEVVVIPYVMPGFALARACAEAYAAQAGPRTIGMVLLQHGVFSFGDTARESYERMVALVSRAEDRLRARRAWDLPPEPLAPPVTPLRGPLAALRSRVSKAAGRPMILRTDQDPKSLGFAQRQDIAKLSQEGPMTPDHVIRTKCVPLLGDDVDAYVAAYQAYFVEHSARCAEPVTMLDPAPRVIVDPRLGICSAGVSARDADIVADIYSHTVDTILRATALGGYRALPEADLFDMEYWDLEQAKLRGAGAPPVFQGEVALVTGAASGIGRACVDTLLARGAAVVGLDRNPDIRGHHSRPDLLGLHCDVTEEAAVSAALESAVLRFGGLDMLVLNAGVFPPSTPVAALDMTTWRAVMRVNLDANLSLMREAYPLLKLAPRSGRVVIIGSKNVPAPGPGAAAYSASKAALNQLARVVALEWGGDGIRVNTLHPNAVFDTGIWTGDVLEARAAHYGISVEQYQRRNVLGRPVTSRDVAELVAELCGPRFACTTGAQVPVDGGNERVI